MGDRSEKDEMARLAPDLRLDIHTEFVSVSVGDGPTRKIRRLSAGKKSPKHHQVPRMLIRRWANKEGKVLWHRSRWESGRVASMRPKKIMRRSDAYTLRVGVDPQIAEQHLAQLESVTADTLQQIDELVVRTPEGHAIRWQGRLLYTQEVFKTLHTSPDDPNRGFQEKAGGEGSRWMSGFGPPGTTRPFGQIPILALMQHEYYNDLAFATSFFHPDHPWYRSAVDPSTEI